MTFYGTETKKRLPTCSRFFLWENIWTSLFYLSMIR
nr:MAG TPA: hypothetical protein [Siphoviridae sp. cty4Z2]